MAVNRWNEKEIPQEPNAKQELVAQAYASRLLGSDPDLALHGGGNTSVKGTFSDRSGAARKALFVKTSGCDLQHMRAEDFCVLDLEYLERLRALPSLSDADMADEFSLHMLKPHTLHASIETLLHAFLPFPFVTHTHPIAVLALTDREHGDALIHEALGNDVAVIPYARVGLELATAAANAVAARPTCRGLVIMHHGLVCWGDHARSAYDTTIELVKRAEAFLTKKYTPVQRRTLVDDTTAQQRYTSLAPIMRGCLMTHDAGSDALSSGIVLQPLLDTAIREVIDAADGKALCVSPPLTPDLIVRAGLLPLWLDAPSFDDPTAFRTAFTKALTGYRDAYSAYVTRHDPARAETLTPYDTMPRVILAPGLGAVCAGSNAAQAAVAADISHQAILAKARIADTGGRYNAITEEHLFDMEFRSLQRAKIATHAQPLKGRVAIVTGSAGAIGRGITAALLNNGCHVALADLPGDTLSMQADEYSKKWGAAVMATAMDVTSEQSVQDAFNAVTAQWGGVDIVIVNAGIAHVSSLVDMDLDAFRKLERVNVDGTLLTIRAAGKLFGCQQAGGDIVLVSTKNVFAPGAKFGAYSATKAAAHQLARIAVVEMADMGVRVNMVSPDAVFSHGATKSGLWAAVGPDRMRARGLDEKGLAEYYRSRNLLKAAVTADHVANAVLFFVTHQTPTTGATIPVDGGLPDATPR